MDNKVDSYNVPSKEHLKVLKEKFNLDGFKDEQWKAISHLMYKKEDVFICAKSAFGKSLIYQYPPVFLGKKALVVCPIISLMESQASKLAALGISACSIGGQQKMNISLKETIIFTTPENFSTIRNICVHGTENKEKDEICLIAVDESHCISKSSADHRHAYAILKNLKETFPNIPIVALTSTASKETTENICKVLELKDPLMLRTPLDRPNIQYISSTQTLCFMTDVKKYLLDIPKNEAAIVYVFKRAETENFSQILTREGFESRPYHSGLVEEIRRETLRDFMSGKLNFLVTTNAFGMGVDRKDVRIVIHYGVPKNPETYYMESGRAGRDGKPAKSIIFWSEKDYKFHNYCFTQNFKKIASHQTLQHSQSLLQKMQTYTVTINCKRATLLGYLEETHPKIITDSCCDNCLKILHDKVGVAKMYKEIGADGQLDVTNDIRMILGLIHSYGGKCKDEFIVDFITGEKLPDSFDSKHPLEFFACGKNKKKSWWLHIVKLIKEKRYSERRTVISNTNNILQLIAQIGISREDYVVATSKGLRFLRMKSKKSFTYPRQEYFISMEKTDNEYYMIDDVIKSRRRGSTSISECDGDQENVAFDFSGFSADLVKNQSPRKRLASESEISDISLNELFKSPHDAENPLKSPKLPRMDENENPGCSHWNPPANTPVGRETRSSQKRNGTPGCNLRQSVLKPLD